MKNSLIQNLYEPQLIGLTKELFEFIQLTYDVKEADTRIIAYFVKVVKENYKYLTYEQLNDAFERNSLGYLDNFFNKVGQRPDNKIRSFNIPDLTKIINAYTKYRSIEKEVEAEKVEWTEDQKSQSNIIWCNFIQNCFDIYRDEKEKTDISVPMFAAEKFAEFGLLDKSEIVNEKVTLKLGKSRNSKNERLIYEVFDALIMQGENISQYLATQRNKYKSEAMPEW